MGQGCRSVRGAFGRGGDREIVKFGAFYPLLVALIKLFKALCLLGTRLKGVFDGTRHMLLRGGDIRMDASGYGGEIAAPSAQH